MHTIFLVHGMGTYKAGWSNSVQTAFKFAEITYDPFFVEYLDAAKKQAADLSKWNKLVATLPDGALGIVRTVVDAASTAPADNFLVNSLGDVGFFVATDIGELIKNDLAKQFTDGLGANFDPAGDRWSMIGHSLGTRVITEFLQAGFTGGATMRAFGKARVLMQVANVSRLLEDLSPLNVGDVYQNAVYPSLASTNGVCTHFINATHRLDPFAFIDEFDPPATFGDGRAFLDSLYHGVKLPAADITSKDVHSLEHYLLHPTVHTTLFQYLIPGSGARGPTVKEMSSAMDDYRQQTLAAKITNAWRDLLSNLKLEPFSTLTQIFAVWQNYGNLL
jgi:hypothetical protein